MYEIFEELLKKNNVTPYKVAKEAKIPYSSLSDWKAGRSQPKPDKLKKIADYFNVTVDYLISGENKENSNVDRFNLEGIIQMDPDSTMRTISNVCKKGRINKDYTENFVSKHTNIELSEYIEFENSNKYIGIGNIIKIFECLDINYYLVTGLLIGALMHKKSSDAENMLDYLIYDDKLKGSILLTYNSGKENLVANSYENKYGQFADEIISDMLQDESEK